MQNIVTDNGGDPELDKMLEINKMLRHYIRKSFSAFSTEK